MGRRRDSKSIVEVPDKNEWQIEKTLAECMRYMLDNEISTDVCFEVESADGEIVKFRAHKYMLISRSPVFAAMFASGMTECRGHPEAKVRIEDIYADEFKEILNYIYCDSVSVCPESALFLMYAAKKYLLPKVVKECQKCLLENLNTDNVIYFLEESLLMGQSELTNDCFNLISLNSKAVLTGAEIMSASRMILELILLSDALPVNELVIYETAINWAKCEHQRIMSTDNPTDLQIRETLGDLLYSIRFPIMKPSEFAEISLGNNVLTAEERESIYYFLSTKKELRQLKFPTERRIGDEGWVDRTAFGSSVVDCPPSSYPRLDSINFKSDQDIVLTGIGLYTAVYRGGNDVDVEILQGVSSLFQKRVTVPFSGDSAPFKVELDDPIVILAEVLYSVKALSHGRIRYASELCESACIKGSVEFTFTSRAESQLTSVHAGQIPRLYFCHFNPGST